jgi:hypothetical protein
LRLFVGFRQTDPDRDAGSTGQQDLVVTHGRLRTFENTEVTCVDAADAPDGHPPLPVTQDAAVRTQAHIVLDFLRCCAMLLLQNSFGSGPLSFVWTIWICKAASGLPLRKSDPSE